MSYTKLETAYLVGKRNVLNSNVARTFLGFRFECPVCGEWGEVEMTRTSYSGKKKFGCDDCKTKMKACHGKNGFKFQFWVRGKGNDIEFRVREKKHRIEKGHLTLQSVIGEPAN